MKRFLKWIAFLPIVAALTITQPSCKKQHLDTLTDTTVNIVGYLRKNPSRFTNIVKMLDRVNISPFLNAYGAYTFFAPTDDAIAIYLKKINKSSVDDLDTATIRNICRLHIIQDTLSTRSFTDGKLPTITMYGQYLITGVGILKDGTAGVLVNRQAYVTQPNVVTGNGYVHEIDHVLEPATKTVAQMVEADSRYNIFTQALKATGLYDTLNVLNNTDTTRRFLTFLAESDSVLKVAGYGSYAALKARYNNTSSPRNTSDSLFLYMAYHIITGLNTPRYVADILSVQSLPSIAPQQVVTVTLVGQQVLLNQATFNGIAEAGIPIDRINSDNTASNGVVHAITGDIFIKIRQPYPVFFDFADQPELRKLTSIFRKAGKFVDLSLGQLADVTWASGTIRYSVEASTSSNFYYWDDLFSFNFRVVGNNYIEFNTPLLVQGKYKVWLCYRRTSGQGQNTQLSVDGVPLPRLVDCFPTLPGGSGTTDAVLESQGYKRYATVMGGPVGSTNTTQIAQLAGVVDITTTDRHKLRLTTLKEGSDAGSNVSNSTAGAYTIDMVQFIPINNDQQYPRFKRDGSVVLNALGW